MLNQWWILVVMLCTYEVLAVPAVTPQNDKVDERQSTQWQDDNEMQRATRLQYPVFLQLSESMLEVNVSINLPSGLLRKTRQSIDDEPVSAEDPASDVDPVSDVDPISDPPEPTMPSLQDYLLFANRQFLAKINRDGTGVQAIRLTHTSGQAPNAIAIDYDIRNDLVVWSDVQFRQIHAAHFNGSNITTLITTEITTPDGLAWDWVNKKLYWTDAEDKDIEVYDAVHQHRKKLIQKGPTAKPRAIVLDPANKLMYWTDWGQPATIERASMDGTSQTVLHNTGLVWPNGLTIDYATQTLYWVDAQLDRIETSTTAGTGRRILSTTYIFHPFGIDVFQGVLYWTDWQARAVLKASVSQPSLVQTVISNLLLDPMSIRTVSLQRQQLSTNPCGTNNGGCSHMCLLSTSNSRGFKCVCPDGSYLGTNQRDCVGALTGPTSAPPIVGSTCTPECENGGTCTSPGVCTCVAGWRGVRCQEAICTPSCMNGGTCTEPGTCSCTAHWQGPTCEQAVCDAGFCLNGGTCARRNFCLCPDGWSGIRCNMPTCASSCQHGSCTGPNTCTCDQGWEGDLCERPICNPSCVHGTCSAPDSCICDSGWEGVLCDDATCNPACLNGGRCDSPNQCTCTAEYTGSQCAEAVCFPPDGCQNGGVCVRPSLCACQAYWTGRRCEEPICNPSCIHGDCTSPGTCVCHTGWTGTRCSEAICYPPSGCLNGGYCIAPGLCSCASGWTGEKCDEGICSRGCLHGNCIAPDDCQCHSGWTGERCDMAECFPECENGGRCIAPGHCSCLSNYYGHRCQHAY